ncbi:uncharacterized protein B0H64DRAFT_475198 [Chaetomium fimeti]|uniref:Zn(2)-C6 fungal-type domain-containing protein n=1 Tax=Chaetomium fimeti TaxID=1854472 RepID=A0AAE0HHF6_9PEZI|nr:hypothetical protein B0H64DRAFT_475198 [Chaetomium fimeti]
MAPSRPTGFACTTCGRQYQHSSHLRRHETTHSGSEEFRCQYCRKAFGRRDVWRKHYQSCPQNNNHDEPPPAKRGKRAKACDACFRSKLSCDGSSQCARCQARRVACVYTRTQGAVINYSTESPAATTSTGTVVETSAAPQDDSTKIPVAFLLSLTNPKAGAMLEAFLGEPRRGDDPPSAELQPDVPLHPDPYQGTAISDGFFLSWLFEQPYPDTNTTTAAAAAATIPTFPFPPPEPLNTTPTANTPPTGIDPTLQPLLTDIQTLHHTLTSTADPSYTGTFDASLAAQVFTRAHRDAFVPTYFRYTHLHLPLVHRPSFDPDTSPPALTLAVFLCGALYAPPRDSVLAVRGFFAVVEEWVFRRLEGLVKGVEEEGGGVEALEGEREREVCGTVQAALLVHGAQFIVNNPAFRSRGWVGRRPALVQAVRRLGLVRARHACYGEGGVDWERWVREETRIRIATWTFVGDWQQGGVTHQPGLATIHEMTGDLPSLPDLWEANDATEFKAAIAANGPGCWRRTASLRDCADALMAESWSGSEGFPLKYISLLDLYFLVTAIQVMIAISRLVSVLQTTIPAIERATDRWQELWRASVIRLDAEELRTSGLVRHCGEYCWLARALLKHAQEGKDRTSPYYQRIGHETPKELHDLLRELRDYDIRPE